MTDDRSRREGEHYLTDRMVATIISALQNERDRIRRDYPELTGEDCALALDAFAIGYRPDSVGMMYRVVTPRFEND